MSLDLPTISVIITCYSEGELIREAVESVMAQTISPLEILLINDASPDELTNQVCQDLKKQKKVDLIQHTTNGGTAAARNSGFELAQGDIIVPLDADDLLPQDAIASIQTAFSESPEIEFVYGQYWRESQKGKPQLICPDDISLSQMLRAKKYRLSTNWTLLGTAPLRRTTWESAGKYDVKFENSDLHDVEFWIRVLSSHPHYQLIDKPIYTWRKYLGRNSRQVTPLAWARVAEKHFDIYVQHGLTYRAYELLLLANKWLHKEEEIRKYTNALRSQIDIKSLRFSMILALLLPTRVIRILGTLIQRQR